MWPSSDRFAITSSRVAECWDPNKRHGACEWWYFDALSDDGSEAVSVVFLDNFAYSPDTISAPTERSPLSLTDLRPAVSFTYFSDGKAVFQAHEENLAGEFEASETEPRCRIGGSGFRYESAIYGTGYLVSIDLGLPDGRRLRANLEWLVINSYLDTTGQEMVKGGHWWNLAAPRCDVSGRITVEDERGRSNVKSFRGTGYHDHCRDDRWLFRSVKEWTWGRAHFADMTAVFFSFSQIAHETDQSHLILIRDGDVRSIALVRSNEMPSGNGRGTRFISESSETILDLATIKLIETNFYHRRSLSRITIHTNGREHSAAAITETIAPRDLRYRWLNWLNELRGLGGFGG